MLERTSVAYFMASVNAVLKINAIYIRCGYCSFWFFDRGVSSFYFHSLPWVSHR